MAMTKHQNLAQGKDPYADQPSGKGTGDTRDRLAGGGTVHHGVHGHGEHGHHHGVPGHGSHGHTHTKKHGR